MVRHNKPMVACIANPEVTRLFKHSTVSLGHLDQTDNPEVFQPTLLISAFLREQHSAKPDFVYLGPLTPQPPAY
jgi:hypothetical protein